MSRKEYYSEDQYDAEQLADDEQAQGYPEPDEDDYDDVAENDLKFVEQMIDFLRAELENAKAVPFSSNRIVDTEKCLNILDDLQDSLPAAVKRGAWVYGQKDEMLRKAQDETRRHIASEEIQFQQKLEKRERRMQQNEQNANNRAEKIIADAERRAANMVKEGVIASRVEDEVRAIRSNAQAQAHELQIRVEDECYKQLDGISNAMAKMLKEVNRMRAEFEEE
ncbi:MAG: hypothetical protein Q4E13_14400 [Clostridia bacterium]|nr:hypothetical protein [Clostridia bacterium]